MASERQLCAERDEIIAVRHRQTLPEGCKHRRDVANESRDLSASASQNGIFDTAGCIPQLRGVRIGIRGQSQVGPCAVTARRSEPSNLQTERRLEPRWSGVREALNKALMY